MCWGPRPGCAAPGGHLRKARGDARSSTPRDFRPGRTPHAVNRRRIFTADCARSAGRRRFSFDTGSAAELLPFLGVLWVLTESFGINGAAIVWTLRSVVDVFAMFWAAGISRRGVASAVVRPAALLCGCAIASRFVGSSLGLALPAAVLAGLISIGLAYAYSDEFLAGYAGILQADAFDGYNRLYLPDRQPGPIIEALCCSHARRKFFEFVDIAADRLITRRSSQIRVRSGILVFTFDRSRPRQRMELAACKFCDEADSPQASHPELSAELAGTRRYQQRSGSPDPTKPISSANSRSNCAVCDGVQSRVTQLAWDNRSVIESIDGGVIPLVNHVSASE